MSDKTNYDVQLSEVIMQQINTIVSELKSIMQDNNISQNSVVSLLDGKCARSTILSFFKGDADCRLSTLLMIMEVCNADFRIETENPGKQS